MTRIKLSCAGAILILLNSCGNSLDSKSLKENTLISAKNSVYQIEDAQSAESLKKILVDFRKVLNNNDSKDKSFEDIDENITLFLTNINSLNWIKQKNTVKKYLNTLLEVENKNSSAIRVKTEESISKSQKESFSDYKTMFPTANLVFGFKIFDKKEKMISKDLLLEEEMKTFELNEQNNGKHLVVGPLLSCIAIVAYNKDKAVVIHQRVERNNQRDIIDTFHKKFNNNNFELLCYYNEDGNSMQKDWIDGLNILDKSLQINTYHNKLDTIDLSKYDNLTMQQRFSMINEVSTYIENCTKKRNTKSEPDLFLAVSVKNGIIEFSNTSMLVNNYLGLELGNNLEENYNKVEANYHKLVAEKKSKNI